MWKPLTKVFRYKRDGSSSPRLLVRSTYLPALRYRGELLTPVGKVGHELLPLPQHLTPGEQCTAVLTRGASLRSAGLLPCPGAVLCPFHRSDPCSSDRAYARSRRPTGAGMRWSWTVMAASKSSSWNGL